jgi:hypothetical protein
MLTLTHAAGDQIKTMISSIRQGLDFILVNTLQLSKVACWPTLVRYIIDKIFAVRSKKSSNSRFANFSFSFQFWLKEEFRLMASLVVKLRLCQSCRIRADSATLQISNSGPLPWDYDRRENPFAKHGKQPGSE